jgi:integral membrane protein
LNFRTALARLRLVGFIEGISALLLFCVAMPWKYLVDFQSGTPVVTAVGTAHGFLWTVYIAAVLNAWIVQKWGIGRVLIAGLASIPPFATFIFDRSLKQEQDRNRVLNPGD